MMKSSLGERMSELECEIKIALKYADDEIRRFYENLPRDRRLPEPKNVRTAHCNTSKLFLVAFGTDQSTKERLAELLEGADDIEKAVTEVLEAWMAHGTEQALNKPETAYADQLEDVLKLEQSINETLLRLSWGYFPPYALERLQEMLGVDESVDPDEPTKLEKFLAMIRLHLALMRKALQCIEFPSKPHGTKNGKQEFEHVLLPKLLTIFDKHLGETYAESNQKRLNRDRNKGEFDFIKEVLHIFSLDKSDATIKRHIRRAKVWMRQNLP